jgi:hypothetical protein
VVPHEVFLQHGCEGLEDVFFCRELYQPRTRRFINYEAELRRGVNLTAAVEGIRVSSSLCPSLNFSAFSSVSAPFPSVSAPFPTAFALFFSPLSVSLIHLSFPSRANSDLSFGFPRLILQHF